MTPGGFFVLNYLELTSHADAVHTDVAFIRTFTVESALCAHIGEAEHSIAAVFIFATFDVIFAFTGGVADSSFATFTIAQAFGTGDARTVAADLPFFTVGIDCTFASGEANTIDAKSAFALRAEYAFDVFGCVAYFRLAGYASAFRTDFIVLAVIVLGALRNRFDRRIIDNTDIVLTKRFVRRTVAVPSTFIVRYVLIDDIGADPAVVPAVPITIFILPAAAAASAVRFPVIVAVTITPAS